MNQVMSRLICFQVCFLLLFCAQTWAQSSFHDEENYSEYEKELIYLESQAVKKEAEELERAEKVTDQAMEQEDSPDIVKDSVSTRFAAPERAIEEKTSSTLKRRVRSR